MAITALSGQRWQGSSTSAKTPTVANSVFLVGSPTWQQADDISYNSGTDKIDFSTDGSSIVDSYATFDLQATSALGSGNNASDTKWVLRFKLELTNYVSADNSSSALVVGISNQGTSTGSASQNGIGFEVGCGNNDTKYRLQTANGAIWARGSADATFTETPADDEITYVEVKRTNASSVTVNLYSDSEYSTLLESKSITGMSGTTGLRYVAVKSDTQSQANNRNIGTVSEINFWNATTSATQDDKATVTDVPTGSQFEETDTRKFYQRSGISNPLSQPSGLGDKVWDLTHASSYMTVDSDIVKTASDATISFWWRPASVSASQGVIKHKSGGSTSDYSFLIEFSPSNMLRLYAVNSSNQSSDIRTNTGILTADTWYHIVLTWDTSAGDGQWYLNGSSITTNSNSTSGVNAPRSTDYQFGSTSQGGESLGGYVSDFAIYDTILPATGSNSIASLYNSGNGAKANTVATSNLRCYWSGKDGDQSTIDNEATGAGADTDADFDTVSNVASAGKTPASWKEKGVAE